MFRSSSTTRMVFTAARIPAGPARTGPRCKRGVRGLPSRPMFATLLGALPPPPDVTDPAHPAHAADSVATLAVAVAAQVEAGLEPITDGEGARDPGDEVV